MVHGTPSHLARLRVVDIPNEEIGAERRNNSKNGTPNWTIPDPESKRAKVIFIPEVAEERKEDYGKEKEKKRKQRPLCYA